jgi:hypothetical protein
VRELCSALTFNLTSSQEFAVDYTPQKNLHTILPDIGALVAIIFYNVT